MSRPRWVPPLAALAVAALGAINIGAVLTTELPARLAGLVLAAHALVLPAGAALLVLSVYLARRRRRAVGLTVGVAATLGVLELVRDTDVVGALVGWGIAGALWLARGAFTVRPRRPTPWVAALCSVLFAGAVLGPLLLTSWPLEAAALSAAGTALGAWLLFRPLRLPGPAVTTATQRRVRRLVQEHGADTLSAFKLRPDLPRFMASDGRAFCAYRVQHRVLLLAGDPVGPPDALPSLMGELEAFADERGLLLGAVGASEAFRAVSGLRSLYLGDEALVRTADFTLEGHRIKKVRQAVNRVARLGHVATVKTVGDLLPAELDELEAVGERWRHGAPERGFSMASAGLRGEHVADSVVVVARDADGRARGYLHFVRAYGRPALSLSAMCRDTGTPNGLTEFLIVEAIRQLREHGVEELSLNFAAFARWLHSPSGPVERALAAVVRVGNRWFQIESLYRFNAKFHPRWQPRYLLFDTRTALPRTALATLQVEGLVPELRLPALPVLRPPVAA